MMKGKLMKSLFRGKAVPRTPGPPGSEASEDGEAVDDLESEIDEGGEDDDKIENVPAVAEKVDAQRPQFQDALGREDERKDLKARRKSLLWILRRLASGSVVKQCSSSSSTLLGLKHNTNIQLLHVVYVLSCGAIASRTLLPTSRTSLTSGFMSWCSAARKAVFKMMLIVMKKSIQGLETILLSWELT